MDSGTQVDLEDIWGIDEKNVWATGTSNQTGQSVILNYHGTRWSVIYNNFSQPPQSDFAFGSVWTDNPKVLYLVGLSVVTEASITDQLFRQHQTGQRYISYRLRGTGRNDIFVTGPGSEVAHYNGSSWYVYPEILAIADQYPTAWWLSVHLKNDDIAIGGFFFTGLNGVPAVIRGSR